MSWSVSACGPAQKIAEQLEQQFQRIQMNDKGEQETVQRVRELIAQTLETFDREKILRVNAFGSMGFRDWQHKTGAFQNVDVKIEPIHFS